MKTVSGRKNGREQREAVFQFRQRLTSIDTKFRSHFKVSQTGSQQNSFLSEISNCDNVATCSLPDNNAARLPWWRGFSWQTPPLTDQFGPAVFDSTAEVIKTETGINAILDPDDYKPRGVTRCETICAWERGCVKAYQRTITEETHFLGSVSGRLLQNPASWRLFYRVTLHAESSDGQGRHYQWMTTTRGCQFYMWNLYMSPPSKRSALFEHWKNSVFVQRVYDIILESKAETRHLMLLSFYCLSINWSNPFCFWFSVKL